MVGLEGWWPPSLAIFCFVRVSCLSLAGALGLFGLFDQAAHVGHGWVWKGLLQQDLELEGTGELGSESFSLCWFLVTWGTAGALGEAVS